MGGVVLSRLTGLMGGMMAVFELLFVLGGGLLWSRGMCREGG